MISTRVEVLQPEPERCSQTQIAETGIDAFVLGDELIDMVGGEVDELELSGDGRDIFISEEDIVTAGAIPVFSVDQANRINPFDATEIELMDSDLEISYDSFKSVLRSFLMTRGCPPDFVEDIYQETFYRVFKNKDKFDPEKGKVSNWIFGIARNLLVDQQRKWRRRPMILDLGDEGDLNYFENIPDSMTSVEELSILRDGISEVNDAMEELPDVQRDAIKDHYFRGMTMTERSKKRGIHKERLKLGFD